MNKFAILYFVPALMGHAYTKGQSVTPAVAPAAQPSMSAQDNTPAKGKGTRFSNKKKRDFPPTYLRNGDLNPGGPPPV